MELSCWGILPWKINVWSLRCMNLSHSRTGSNCSETPTLKMNINECPMRFRSDPLTSLSIAGLNIFHHGNWQIPLMMMNSTIIKTISQVCFWLWRKNRNLSRVQKTAYYINSRTPVTVYFFISFQKTRNVAEKTLIFIKWITQPSGISISIRSAGPVLAATSPSAELRKGCQADLITPQLAADIQTVLHFSFIFTSRNLCLLLT